MFPFLCRVVVLLFRFLEEEDNILFRQEIKTNRKKKNLGRAKKGNLGKVVPGGGMQTTSGCLNVLKWEKKNAFRKSINEY